MALTPLLILTFRTGRRAALLWALGAGYLANVTCIFWLHHVTWAGMLLLSLYMALYWPVAVALIRWVHERTGWPLLAVVPPVWVSLECFRGWFLTGFPWYYLGHSQSSNRLLLQFVDIAGVYGISFLLAASAAVLADLYRTGLRGRRWRKPAAVLVALLAAHGYGALRLAQYESRPGPRALLVQGNVEQSLKHDKVPLSQMEILERQVELSAVVPGEVDMIVWAETMMPVALNQIFLYPRQAREEGGLWVAAMEGLAEMGKTGAHLLIGAIAIDPANGAYYNAVYYISPEGRLIGRYDKIRLVPFGEYVPLRTIFPFLAVFRPAIMGPDLSPGRDMRLFDLPYGDGRSASFGITICYEDAEVGLVRDFARQQPDFMLNVTNDGWFHDSSELDMHLAMCRFRAVETRVPWVRSTNTGISAIIDATGRVTARLTENGRDRLIMGALKADTPLGNLQSPYMRIGDAFVAILCAASVALVGIAWRKGRAPATERAPQTVEPRKRQE